MRKLMMQIGLTGLLALALIAPAAAGTLYKWTGVDGGFSYTDDLERVPQQYRASVVQVKTGGLASYERYTPANDPAGNERHERLMARLERLRAINAETEVVAPSAMAAPAGAPAQVLVQIDRRHSVAVPTLASDSGEPVVVERRRVLVPGRNVTEHVTIVRQGDRILSVFRPDVTQQSANWRKAGERLGEFD